MVGGVKEVAMDCMLKGSGARFFAEGSLGQISTVSRPLMPSVMPKIRKPMT